MSRRNEMLAEIYALHRKAEARMRDAKDPSIRALRPAAIEWLDSDEMNRLSALQGAVDVGEASRAAERVRAKRASRLAARGDGARP